jgi:hypothetical protein
VKPAPPLIDIVLLITNGTGQEDSLVAIVRNELLPMMSIAPVIIAITMLNTAFLSRYAKTRLFGDNRFNNNCMEKNFK